MRHFPAEREHKRLSLPVGNRQRHVRVECPAGLRERELQVARRPRQYEPGPLDV